MIKAKLYKNVHWMPSSQKLQIRWPPLYAGHRLTLDPMGKCSNAFFSETTNMIKAKLDTLNVHWMIKALQTLDTFFVPI